MLRNLLLQLQTHFGKMYFHKILHCFHLIHFHRKVSKICTKIFAFFRESFLSLETLPGGNNLYSYSVSMYKDEKARLQEQIREIQRLSGAAQTNFQGNGIVI